MRIPIRAFRMVGTPLVLAGLVTGITSGQVLADCTQLSPWPSFTASASSADRITSAP